jgi:hypothetical protein
MAFISPFPYSGLDKVWDNGTLIQEGWRLPLWSVGALEHHVESSISLLERAHGEISRL